MLALGRRGHHGIRGLYNCVRLYRRCLSLFSAADPFCRPPGLPFSGQEDGNPLPVKWWVDDRIDQQPIWLSFKETIQRLGRDPKNVGFFGFLDSTQLGFELRLRSLQGSVISRISGVSLCRPVELITSTSGPGDRQCVVPMVQRIVCHSGYGGAWPRVSGKDDSQCRSLLESLVHLIFDSQCRSLLESAVCLIPDLLCSSLQRFGVWPLNIPEQS